MITLLQRNAFVTSADFLAQVNGVVSRTAIYRVGAWAEPPKPPLDDTIMNALANVARSPQNYGFPSVIVTDNNWNMTYDVWAADPPGADAEIESKVQAHWLMLTGIKEPVAPEPEP